MHNRITKITDAVAINFLVYIISFVWLRYYLDNLTASILLALALTAGVYLLFQLLTKRGKDKKALKKRELQDAARYMSSLILSPPQDATDYLYSLFRMRYDTLVKRANCMLAADLTICPVLKLEKLTRQDVVDASKLALSNDTPRLLIVTNSAERELLDFAADITPLEIEIADAETLYRFMAKHNRFPDNVIEVKKQKVKLSQLLNFAFNKKRAKGYILTGLLLILTSFLTWYKIYYIVTGSVLLALALFSLVNKRFNNIDTPGKMLD